MPCTTRAAIVEEARAWIGTRWQHQASLKGVACDCIGLVAGVARELGIPEAEAFQQDPRFRGYGRTPDPKMLRLALEEYLDAGTWQAGDVLLLRNDRDPQPSHFAILSDPDSMIHAYAQARKVVEHSIDAKWRSMILGYYAFRSIS